MMPSRLLGAAGSVEGSTQDGPSFATECLHEPALEAVRLGPTVRSFGVLIRYLLARASC